MKKAAWVLFSVIVLACGLIISGGRVVKAQTATDTQDIGTASETSDLEKGGQAIQDAADQRDEKEDLMDDPANAPIPGDN